jgi:hypothetical protein
MHTDPRYRSVPGGRRGWRATLIGLAIGAVALSTAAFADAATVPRMPDVDAQTFLTVSWWDYANQLDDVDSCTGTGRAYRTITGYDHTSYRCTVEKAGAKIVVLAKVVGPEWLKVTQVSGGLKLDRGFGPIPAGKLVMDGDDADVAVPHTSYARREGIEDAVCAGVGPYVTRTEAYGGRENFFGAFQCDTGGGPTRDPEVIVKVTSPTKVSIVRSLRLPQPS